MLVILIYHYGILYVPMTDSKVYTISPFGSTKQLSVVGNFSQNLSFATKGTSFTTGFSSFAGCFMPVPCDSFLVGPVALLVLSGGGGVGFDEAGSVDGDEIWSWLGGGSIIVGGLLLILILLALLGTSILFLFSSNLYSNCVQMCFCGYNK